MPKKRNFRQREGRLPGDDTTDAPPPKRRTEIRVGSISDVSGNVNVVGGDITRHHTTSNLSVVEITRLFDGLYTDIDAQAELSIAHREEIKAEVKKIQSLVNQSVQKSEKVDERFLSRHFRNIARIAPNILDMIVNALGNPLAGLGVAIEKIAYKVKTEF